MGITLASFMFLDTVPDALDLLTTIHIGRHSEVESVLISFELILSGPELLLVGDRNGDLHWGYLEIHETLYLMWDYWRRGTPATRVRSPPSANLEKLISLLHNKSFTGDKSRPCLLQHYLW